MHINVKVDDLPIIVHIILRHCPTRLAPLLDPVVAAIRLSTWATGVILPAERGVIADAG